MPQISVNYFCVENNYFIVALCNAISGPKSLRYCRLGYNENSLGILCRYTYSTIVGEEKTVYSQLSEYLGSLYYVNTTNYPYKSIQYKYVNFKESHICPPLDRIKYTYLCTIEILLYLYAHMI